MVTHAAPRTRLLVGLIVLLTAGLYIQILQRELVWDEHTLTAQRFVATPSWEHYQESFQQTQRPLALVSVAVDWLIWRGWPPGFAIDSLLYHLIVVGLLYRLCRRWLAEFPSLTASLIVALHPIGAETVHYLLGRPDLLSVLWMLVALLAVTAARDRAHPAGQLAMFYGACLLALLSKETAVLLPLLALVVAWPTSATKGARRFLWPAVALSPLVVFVVPLVFGRVGLLAPASGGTSHLEWDLAGVATMAAVTVQAMKLILAPFGYCPWYEGLIPQPPAANLVAGFYLVSVIGAIGLAWALRKRAPAVALGLAWLLGILLMIAARANTAPPPMNPLSVRWLYPSVIGLALVIGGLLHRTASRWPLGSRLLASVALSALIPLNWQAQPVWQNDLALFQRAVECNPRSAFITLQYVDVLSNAGRQDQADRLFAGLLARQPNHPRVLSRLVRLAIDQGDYAEAIGQSRKLIHVAPSLLAYRTMADLLMLTDQPDAAIEAYRMALSDNPRDMLAITSLGNAYESRRDWDKAAEFYQYALTNIPNAANLWFRQGRVFEQSGRLQEAAGAFERVIQLDRDCPDGYLAGARVQRTMNNPVSAEQLLERYRAFTHHMPIPRRIGDPLDSPCGAEPKIMYGMKIRAMSLAPAPVPRAQP